MRYLIDTSVWIDHLAKSVPELIRILEQPGSIVVHPLVMGEILLSNSKKALVLYKELSHFPLAPMASNFDIESFILNHPVQGKGIGLIDVHLLFTALENQYQLLTHDKKLQRIYKELSSAKKMK